MLAWAQLAEELGFHFAMISDHVAITPDVQGEFPAPFYDPFIALGWIAAQTSTLELGTTVTILPYRHPLLTARMAANLDQLSGGRFILGVGAGWAKEEFHALGVPFHRRGAIADEYLEVIRLSWRRELVSFEGQFVSFRDVQSGPRPVRPSGPAIWVGGSSSGALKRAARHGDAWHPYRVRLPWVREQALPALQRFASEAGRPVPALCPRIRLRITPSPLPEDTRFAGEGTLGQVRADLQAFDDLRAPYILLDTYTGSPDQTLAPDNDWALLRQLAEEVLDLEGECLR